METEFCKITAIIRPDCLENVEVALRALAVPGVNVAKVKGYGEYSDFYKPDWMCAHVRIEIFIGQHRADAVATATMDAAHTGMTGDGIVAVLPMQSVYHMRNKEKCRHDVCH